jgi:excisionase family DNA binding protein
MTSSSERLLTADEVAALLQVTKAWVYDQTRRHRMPHVRLGRYVRYRRAAVEEWLARLEAESVS